MRWYSLEVVNVYSLIMSIWQSWSGIRRAWQCVKLKPVNKNSFVNSGQCSLVLLFIFYLFFLKLLIIEMSLFFLRSMVCLPVRKQWSTSYPFK